MRYGFYVLIWVTFCLLLSHTHAASLFNPAKKQTVLPPVVVTPEPIPEETVEPVPMPRMSLYWENTDKPHPERAPWSDYILAEVGKDLSVYDGASDITQICPKYHQFSKELRIKTIGEIYAIATYYESGYDPEKKYYECAKYTCKYLTSGGCKYVQGHGFCMKGGHKLDNGVVISRGLMQLSLESAQGYGCKFLHEPKDLHDPEKNLRCANTVMVAQIKRTGKILSNSNYWAVLKPTSSYNQIEKIKSRVHKQVPACK